MLPQYLLNLSSNHYENFFSTFGDLLRFINGEISSIVEQINVFHSADENIFEINNSFQDIVAEKF